MTDHSHDAQVEAAALFAALPSDMQELALASLRRLSHHNPYTGPFGWLLGLRYLDRTPGRVICAMEVDESLYNPGKVAHGGVMYTLIDSAMGASVYTTLDPGWGCATAELKVNYLRPIRKGTITASANVLQRGRTLAVVTAEVRDERDTLVGIGLGTFAIFKRN